MYPNSLKNKQPALDLDSLPDFMKTSSQQVKFHSAFPPLSTKVRVKSVMERAGFDVYKPSQTTKQRNFTAPIKPYVDNKNMNKLQSTGSSPSLGKPRAISTSNTGTSSSPNLLFDAATPNSNGPPVDKATYVKNRLNLFTSENDLMETSTNEQQQPPPPPPIINRNNKPVLEGELILPNISSPVEEDDDFNTNGNNFTFEIPPRKDLIEQPDENIMKLPDILSSPSDENTMKLPDILPLPSDENTMKLADILPLTSNEDTMKLPVILSSPSDEQLYTPISKSRVTSLSTNNKSDNDDDNDSLDSFDRKFEADMHIGSNADPISQLNQMKSTIGVPDQIELPLSGNEPFNQFPEGKRLSTMDTDDMNIYNLNGFQNDMSIIAERTFEGDADLSVVPDIQLLNEEEEGIPHSTSVITLPVTLDEDLLMENGFTKHSANVIDSPNLKQSPKLPTKELLPDNKTKESIKYDNFPHYEPGKGPCRKCHLVINESEKKIWSKDSQLSGQWHRKCFGCYQCGSKFSKGSSCYVFEDAPYCELHFHELNGSLCKACNSGVEGECMQNDLDEVFHFDCLRCGHCGKTVAGGDYFTFKNEIICEFDANNIMKELQSPTSEDKLLKRRTRIMYL